MLTQWSLQHSLDCWQRVPIGRQLPVNCTHFELSHRPLQQSLSKMHTEASGAHAARHTLFEQSPLQHGPFDPQAWPSSVHCVMQKPPRQLPPAQHGWLDAQAAPSVPHIVGGPQTPPPQWPLQHCVSSTQAAPSNRQLGPASKKPVVHTPAKQRPVQQLWLVAHIAPAGKQLLALLQELPSQRPPQHWVSARQKLPSTPHARPASERGSHVPPKQKPEQQLWFDEHVAPSKMQLPLHTLPWQRLLQHCESNEQLPPSGPQTPASTGGRLQTLSKQPPMQQRSLAVHMEPKGRQAIAPLHTPDTQPPSQQPSSDLHAPPAARSSASRRCRRSNSRCSSSRRSCTRRRTECRPSQACTPR